MISGDYSAVRWPSYWKIHEGESQGMVKATNDLFNLYPNESWYGFLNDRARPKEEGWWETLLESVDGGWANQSSLGMKNGRIRMKNGIMDGDLVRKLGWFWPPTFRHLWVDDAMEDLLYEAGLFHQTNVKIEEEPMAKHPRFGNDHSAYVSWRGEMWHILDRLCQPA